METIKKRQLEEWRAGEVSRELESHERSVESWRAMRGQWRAMRAGGVCALTIDHAHIYTAHA